VDCAPAKRVSSMSTSGGLKSGWLEALVPADAWMGSSRGLCSGAAGSDGGGVEGSESCVGDGKSEEWVVPEWKMPGCPSGEELWSPVLLGMLPAGLPVIGE
jgi:hypothetical protein